MSNPWLTPRRASALSPPSLAAGDDQNPIPPLPPDPPDLGQYPPLSPSSTKTILARNSSPKTVVSVKGTSTSTVGSAEAKSTLKPKIIGSEGKTEAPLPASVTPPPTVNVSPAAQQEPQKSFVQQMPQNSSTQQTPSLVEKIRRLEDKSLTRLAPVSFAENGRQTMRVSEANCLLQVVQVKALEAPTETNLLQEREALQKWLFLRQIEESYFRQKSRVNWLKEGDQNTAYFFRVFQTRVSYNSIRTFQLSSGIFISDPLLMSHLAIKHFQSILGPETLHPLLLTLHPSWFSDLTGFVFPQRLTASMTSIPSSTEITKVMFKLNPNKAPGPDGLTSGFFKATWSLLGDEVVCSITDFFLNSFLPATTNSAILSLVPKRLGASFITDYRPIACLNTIYKVISRLLVRRLKPVLSSIIVPNQTAFVKDRLLLENTVLAGELVNGYHKRHGPKRITIKVDIAKAFDTLSWEFLFNCLQGLGVPEILTGWLRKCVCTTNFMIGYNGRVQGYFKGKRGLRQGDPLSPYLFVVAMNILSVMLNKAAADLKIKYHHKCATSKLTHLCFADDLLIFIDGSIESVQNVLQVLKEFEMRSGLAVSIEKSSFFASGLTQQELDAIKVSTGMQQGSLPVRYLGVPLSSKKLSLANCEVLLHQIKGKMTSWSAKTLSFAGRLLLIKTVIAGINNFWCSTFILPKECIRRINSICGHFLWQRNLEGVHNARVSWEMVTKTKKEGGLGIKDLGIWNKACCLKLIWLLFFQSGSVWVAWYRNEVLNGCINNFWTAKKSPTNSWLDNKLLKLRGEVFTWIKLRVGDGTDCRFWTDNWSSFGSLQTYLLRNSTSRLGIPATATLSEINEDGNWLLPPARSEELLNLQVYLTELTLTAGKDRYEWVLEDKPLTKFVTGDVYTKLKGETQTLPWTKLVWIKGGVPKHSFLTWLFALDRCPTRDRLLRWGLQTDSNCLLCNMADESRDHLYFLCPFAWSLWTLVAQRCRLVYDRRWDHCLTQLQSLSGNKYVRRVTLLGWQSTVYWIWSERNNRLHRNSYRTVDALFRLLDRQIRDKFLSHRDHNPLLASKLMQIWLPSD
ncbi:PREDICTED: uncharacterized protein LOC106303347 [Brassica oleracea var. oleracea]|uniref:uncharacterized protein LOC106303347 n=1 Tax=Brassica oleracea var. oleracea TaxID=109376 RepID=UPI0006A71CF8|nr:PREDICTED: uncharacterized protein LOC106303347 [Brassica oleracea var. oleracea]